MDWWELSVETESEAADAVAEVFRRFGGRGAVVEQRGPLQDGGKVCVKTYLAADESLATRRAEIDLGIRLLNLIRPLGPVVEKRLSEEDWAKAWRKNYPVLHIGRRVVVCPTWRKYSAKEEEIVVRLDPGMAF
ncbi:MAG: 50S ribosomal protein L11 methyltransferase, partial [Dehalococcoidia bacterium]